jgi:hypothetical protein
MTLAFRALPPLIPICAISLRHRSCPVYALLAGKLPAGGADSGVSVHGLFLPNRHRRRAAPQSP